MRTVLFAAAAAWLFTPRTPPQQPALQLQPALDAAPVIAPLPVRGAAPSSATGQPVLWFLGGAVAAAVARPLALAATGGSEEPGRPAERRGAAPGRRGAVQGAVACALGGLLAVTPPGPASARSKAAAEAKAVQKATAKEAREAMKEYKFAPRPELEGNAETGYSFKAGTVKAGSTGELAGYFQDKGAKIQEDYRATKLRATGATTEEAQRLAAASAKKAPAAKRQLTNDELIILERQKALNGQRDDMGRCLGLTC